MLRFLSVILSFLASCGGLSGGEVISIRGMEAGEELEIRYSSSGCFHAETYDMLVKDRVIVFSRQNFRRDGVTRELVETGKVAIGRKRLSDAEVEGLDLLFKYYESEHDGGCTTVDSISIILKSRDGGHRQVKYTDASCNAASVRGVITFGDVMAGLEQES